MRILPTFPLLYEYVYHIYLSNFQVINLCTRHISSQKKLGNGDNIIFILFSILLCSPPFFLSFLVSNFMIFAEYVPFFLSLLCIPLSQAPVFPDVFTFFPTCFFIFSFLVCQFFLLHLLFLHLILVPYRNERKSFLFLSSSMFLMFLFLIYIFPCMIYFWRKLCYVSGYKYLSSYYLCSDLFLRPTSIIGHNLDLVFECMFVLNKLTFL